jgi:hypothetical protein
VSVRTATTSSVSGAATSTVLFAEVEPNLADIRTIVNDSTAVLYVKFGATASATDYTAKLNPGAYYEFPRGKDGSIYTGVVHGIWASATGAARLTQAV